MHGSSHALLACNLTQSNLGRSQMLAEVSLHEDIAGKAVALKDEMVKKNLDLQTISDEAVLLRRVRM